MFFHNTSSYSKSSLTRADAMQRLADDQGIIIFNFLFKKFYVFYILLSLFKFNFLFFNYS